jgi:deazaflavin-dependent oxidoreductase (nitroreductase family)
MTRDESVPARQPILPSHAPRPFLRRLFRLLNRSLTLPAFRLGLAHLLVNPAVGYILVLKTTGRRSGQARYAPVNYAIMEGSVYCVAGWGRRTHWFANLLVDPRVELRLPGGTLIGRAEEVTDPAEARRAIVRIARNAGLGLIFDRLNPLTATDADVLARNGWMPVVRIRPTGLVGGAHDPGGRGWLLPTGLALLWLLRRAGGRRRRLRA